MTRRQLVTCIFFRRNIRTAAHFVHSIPANAYPLPDIFNGEGDISHIEKRMISALCRAVWNPIFEERQTSPPVGNFLIGLQ